MNEYRIVKTDFFAKQVKKLSKRYRNIETDIDNFLEQITAIDDLGIALGNNLFKARLKNTSAQRGKRGGYRLITHVNYPQKQIAFIYIYSKSDLENVSEQELDEIIKRTSLS